ncbi:MAG TPA: hypothetical protein VIY48_00920 [Candidatus Paceibacterota bacterium]
MQSTIQTTGFAITNPYATHSGVPLVDLQLLLLGAAVCLVVGLLLAEQTTLRRILASIDQTLGDLVGHSATETI